MALNIKTVYTDLLFLLTYHCNSISKMNNYVMEKLKQTDMLMKMLFVYTDMYTENFTRIFVSTPTPTGTF